MSATKMTRAADAAPNTSSLGHRAVVEDDGQPKVSILAMACMTTHCPHPRLEDVVNNALPAFADMLSERLGVE